VASSRGRCGFSGFVNSPRPQHCILIPFTLTAASAGVGCCVLAPHIETGATLPKYPRRRKTLSLKRESALTSSKLPPLRTGARDRGPENGHCWARPIFRRLRHPRPQITLISQISNGTKSLGETTPHLCPRDRIASFRSGNSRVGAAPDRSFVGGVAGDLCLAETVFGCKEYRWGGRREAENRGNGETETRRDEEGETR